MEDLVCDQDNFKNNSFSHGSQSKLFKMEWWEQTFLLNYFATVMSEEGRP